MDGGILPDLAIFVLNVHICVEVDWYLCDNVFVFVGENSGAQSGFAEGEAWQWWKHSTRDKLVIRQTWK